MNIMYSKNCSVVVVYDNQNLLRHYMKTVNIHIQSIHNTSYIMGSIVVWYYKHIVSLNEYN